MTVSVLVLSACSSEKDVNPVVSCEGIDQADRTKLVDRYPEATLSAEELYAGDEHKYVQSAVDELQEMAEVDWRIVSAGFGLVDLDTALPSYECTFSHDVVSSLRERVEGFGENPNEYSRAELLQIIGEQLGLPTDLEDAVSKGPDVVFVVLGRNYLLATGDGLSTIPKDTTAFALTPESARDLTGDCGWVPSTETEREKLGTTWTRLKGRQLRNVVRAVETASDLRGSSAEEIRNASLAESA